MHGPGVSLANPLVTADQRSQGHRLGRRKGEVVENPSIRRNVFAVLPSCLEPLREPLARRRMLVLTEPQKFFRAHFSGQPEPLGTQAKPLAGDPLALVVVVADAEMFLEVTLGILETVLRLCRDHASKTTRKLVIICVSAT